LHFLSISSIVFTLIHRQHARQKPVSMAVAPPSRFGSIDLHPGRFRFPQR
jgi:hypothetical protein